MIWKCFVKWKIDLKWKRKFGNRRLDDRSFRVEWKTTRLFAVEGAVVLACAVVVCASASGPLQMMHRLTLVHRTCARSRKASQNTCRHMRCRPSLPPFVHVRGWAELTKTMSFCLELFSFNQPDLSFVFSPFLSHFSPKSNQICLLLPKTFLYKIWGNFIIHFLFLVPFHGYFCLIACLNENEYKLS